MPTPRVPLAPPEQLPSSIGRYTLQELVGRGAGGTVYRATLNGPAGFRKRLAVKLIAGGSSSDVVSEARWGALLDHPNLVEIYDLTYEDPWWLVAMEWVRGPTLLAVLNARGALPGRALQQVGAQLTSALAHAHGLEVDGEPHPVVHRDLKPSNVLFTPSGAVKLTDLGLAALAGTSHPHAVGTPGYLAPEQLMAGGKVDPRTDQFALGILLAEMALGRRMVQGRTVEDVQARHERLSDEIDRGLLQRTLDKVLPGLGEVVARCLALPAHLRFEDVTALAQALAAAAATGAPLEEWMSEGGPATTQDRPNPLSEPSPRFTSGVVPLFGRAADQAALIEAVGPSRLVTVQGVGGVGKSALARRYAMASDRRFAGGACTGELGSVRDVNGVCAAVASSLGLPLGAGPQNTVVTQVGHQLRARGAVLVLLDDADAALEAVREVLGVWMSVATEACFVVTSRQRLQLDSERVVRIEPLAVSDAVTVLRDRAVRAGGGDAWQGPGHEPVLTALASELDGLPLALELAVTRASELTPAQVLARIEARRGLVRLEPGPPSALETVLCDSWDQLPPAEQRGLAQLSVFRGGFALEDAERIVEREPEDPWVTDLVQSLVDRSLVVAHRTSGGPRFTLYASIRQYAARQLGDRSTVALRHARWFGRLGKPAYVLSPPHDPERAGQAADLDNCVAGVEAALRAGHHDIAADCAVAAGRVIVNRGPLRRGIEIVERVLPVVPGHAALLEVAARLAMESDDPRAQEWAERALAQGSDRREQVAAALVLATIHHRAGRVDEAKSAIEHARLVAHLLGDPVTEGRVALVAGYIGHAAGDPAARGLLGYAWRVGRLTHHRELTIRALLRLAEVASHESDPVGAQRRLGQALDLCRDLPRFAAEAYRHSGQVAQLMGHNDEARQHLNRALEVYRRMGLRRNEAGTLLTLALIDMSENRLEDARQLYENLVAIGTEMGNWRGRVNSLVNLGIVTFRLGRMGEASEAIAAARVAAEDIDMHLQVGVADTHLVLIDLEEARPQRARDRGLASVARLEALGSLGRHLKHGACAAVANAWFDLGEWAKAREVAERALAEASEVPPILAVNKLERGCAMAMQGERSEASAMLREAAADAERATDAWVVSFVALRRAELAWQVDDLDGMAEALEPLTDERVGPLRGLRAHYNGLSALLAARRGGGAPALVKVRAAIARLETLGMVARARRLRAWVG